jgi:hypothetical protein
MGDLKLIQQRSQDKTEMNERWISYSKKDLIKKLSLQQDLHPSIGYSTAHSKVEKSFALPPRFTAQSLQMCFKENISSILQPPQPSLTGTRLEVWKGKGRWRRFKGRKMKETMVSVKIENYQQKKPIFVLEF